MASEEQVLLIRSFTGIDQTHGEHNSNASGSPDAQNMLAREGALATAPGSALYTHQRAPAPIRTLMDYHKRNWDGTVTDWLIAAAGGSLYTLAPGQAPQPLASGMISDAYSFINYQHEDTDIIIFANGSGVLQKWDGKGLPEPLIAQGPQDPATSRYLTLHYERVWAAGDREHMDRLYYSRAFNPYDWSAYDASDEADAPEMAGGAIDIPTWDGSVIRGVANLFDDVVIFKDHSIHRIVGSYPGQYEAVRVHGSVGCVSDRSIVTVKDGVYFWGREGICKYDGASAYPLEDKRIAPFARSVNPAALDRVCAACFDSKLFFALPEGDAAENTCLLIYDLATGNYMIRRGLSVLDLRVFGERLLMACADGSVQVYGQGSDWAGERMDCHWTTPWLDWNAKYANKTVTRVYFSGYGQVDDPQNPQPQLRIEAFTDRGGPPKVRELTLPAAPGPITRKSLLVRGRALRLRLSNIKGRAFTLTGGVSVTLESDMD